MNNIDPENSSGIFIAEKCYGLNKMLETIIEIMRERKKKNKIPILNHLKLMLNITGPDLRFLSTKTNFSIIISIFF